MVAKISIVIPCYNSGQNIDELIRQIFELEKSNGYDFEVICVNDCSKDDTIFRLKALAKKYPKVKAIDLFFNVGQFMALMCGFEYATGEYVITMDDDLQHPTSQIPVLIDDLLNNPEIDIVIGSYGVKKHNLFRNLGSKLVHSIDRFVFKKPKDIDFTSFRIIRKDVVEALVEHKTMYPLISPLLYKCTKKIKNAKVVHSERMHGTSNYSLLKLVNATFTHIFNFSILPLKIISYMGLITFICSILISLYYLIKFYLGNIDVPGWITNVLLINFFGGLILFTLGIIGAYLIRIMFEVKGFPRFKVRKIYNQNDSIES